jgi:hypothetical protein
MQDASPGLKIIAWFIDDPSQTCLVFIFSAHLKESLKKLRIIDAF